MRSGPSVCSPSRVSRGIQRGKGIRGVIGTHCSASCELCDLCSGLLSSSSLLGTSRSLGAAARTLLSCLFGGQLLLLLVAVAVGLGVVLDAAEVAYVVEGGRASKGSVNSGE